MEKNGVHNIYKLRLTGYKEPEILFDLEALDVYGNVTEIEDCTKPAYNMKKLYQQNQDNILGGLIKKLGDSPEESMEYMALCEGVRALMETRKS